MSQRILVTLTEKDLELATELARMSHTSLSNWCAEVISVAVSNRRGWVEKEVKVSVDKSL